MVTGCCHWKAEVPCSVPCLGQSVPKGQEVLLAAPKERVRMGISAAILQDTREDQLKQPGSPCAAGQFPALLLAQGLSWAL